MGFGSIGELNPVAAVEIFVGVLGVIVVLDVVLGFSSNWATRHKYESLYAKLTKELLQLGIISFIILLFNAAGFEATHDHAYTEAFDFAHLIVLFIAFSFVILAVFLIKYASDANRDYLLVIRQDPGTLLKEYQELDKNGSWFQKFRFFHVPSWVALAPKLRTDIECKIFERLFLTTHNFPHNFNSAKYMGILKKEYISKLGEIKKLSWFVLAILAAANFARIVLVDPHLQHYAQYVCHASAVAQGVTYSPTSSPTWVPTPYNPAVATFVPSPSPTFTPTPLPSMKPTYAPSPILTVWPSPEPTLMPSTMPSPVPTVEPTTFSPTTEPTTAQPTVEPTSFAPSPSRRILTGSSFESSPSRSDTTMQCPESILLYAFILSCALTLLLLSVFIASSAYYNKIIIMALKFDGLDFVKDGRKAYSESLNLFKKEVEDLNQHIMSGRDTGAQSTIDDLIAQHEREIRRKQHHDYLIEKSLTSKKKRSERMRKLKRVEENAIEFASQAVGRNSLGRNQSLIQKHVHNFERLKYDTKIRNDEMHAIFAFHNPAVFLYGVELSLFLQCVYMSFCATQLLPFAVGEMATASGAGLWCAAYIIPMIYNFHLLRQTLHMTVQIKAVVELDKAIFGRVCEESRLEKSILDSMAGEIRDRMKANGITRGGLIIYLRQLFQQYDEDDDGSLDKMEFLEMLGDMDIFMTPKGFELVWAAIDYNISGIITWNELTAVVFPELKPVLDVMEPVAKVLKLDWEDNFRSKSQNTHTTLEAQFDAMAVRVPGFLSKTELKAKLNALATASKLSSKRSLLLPGALQRRKVREIVSLSSDELEMIFDEVVVKDANKPLDRMSFEEYAFFVIPERMPMLGGSDNTSTSGYDVENGETPDEWGSLVEPEPEVSSLDAMFSAFTNPQSMFNSDNLPLGALTSFLPVHTDDSSATTPLGSRSTHLPAAPGYPPLQPTGSAQAQSAGTPPGHSSQAGDPAAIRTPEAGSPKPAAGPTVQPSSPQTGAPLTNAQMRP